MTTGTGLALLGVWLTTATCWHSNRVPGVTALMATVGAIALTIYLK